jgi:hypothetical protein
MPFDKKFDDVYQLGIKQTSEEVGAYAERVDEQDFVGNMMERVFNQISKADVIVADMTGRNPNVFYEVGYAHALGKVVLLLTQRAADIPFDLKQQPHIIYGESIVGLRQRLGPKLKWAIAQSKTALGASSERFAVTVGELTIPEAIQHKYQEVIELGCVAVNSSIELPVSIRNDSLEMSPILTHVYLQLAQDSRAWPYESSRNSIGQAPEWAYSGLQNIRTTFYVSGSMPTPLRGYPIAEARSGESLTRQCRLNISIPSLPPGASEDFELKLYVGPETEVAFNQEFRLRLHSPSMYHNYPFRLNIVVRKKEEG